MRQKRKQLFHFSVMYIQIKNIMKIILLIFLQKNKQIIYNLWKIFINIYHKINNKNIKKIKYLI